MKVFADKLGYEQRTFMNFNKLWFLWKTVDLQLNTIHENARIGDCYQCAKFHACIKKCTICLKFRVMPPDYLNTPRHKTKAVAVTTFSCKKNLHFV